MTDAIEKRLEFDAAPERVWKALTEGDELVQWFPDAGAFDLRSGATGAFTWADHGSHAVRVEVFEPPTYLAWRWVSQAGTDLESGHSTLVEFRLGARPGGGTIVDLRESGFVREEARQENVSGWKHELAELADFLAG